MAKLIEMKDVHKSFGENKVLKGINLAVEKGEVLGIIGSSGSGKSTMVRCLACLESIESGEILVNGAPISCTQDVAGRIGMVFQQFNLFPHYSVLDNISKPLQTVKGMAKTEADAIARNQLERVQMGHAEQQFPNTLSGGQKQRVAIARALAMDPEILLFDEPTSSLDPELAHEVFQTIQTLAREGQTMLIVTHQLNAISHFATRIAFLNKGVIEVDGPVEEAFNGNNEALNNFLKMVEFDDL